MLRRSFSRTWWAGTLARSPSARQSARSSRARRSSAPSRAGRSRLARRPSRWHRGRALTRGSRVWWRARDRRRDARARRRREPRRARGEGRRGSERGREGNLVAPGGGSGGGTVVREARTLGVKPVVGSQVISLGTDRGGSHAQRPRDQPLGSRPRRLRLRRLPIDNEKR
jgi:hypothetical protein